MTVIIFPMCSWCNRFNGYEPIMTCRAYPEGIPQEIINNLVDHRKPYKGDHGIQYEGVKDFPSRTFFDKK